MKIKKFTLKPLDTNCYILYKGNNGIVIDPGGYIESIFEFIKDNNLKIKQILNTHLHFDHTLENRGLQKETGAKIYANIRDKYLLDTELGRGGVFGLPKVESFEFENIDEGEYEFLGEKVAIFSTPGHTPGSLSFYFPKYNVIFSGDLIFYQSVGRTDFPGGDFETLKSSIREKIYTLPNTTFIYPGHGAITTVEKEKRHNPFIKG